MGGKIPSLGSDARIEELTRPTSSASRGLASAAGFGHIEPGERDRVASARTLYNFDALKDQRY